MLTTWLSLHGLTFKKGFWIGLLLSGSLILFQGLLSDLWKLYRLNRLVDQQIEKLNEQLLAAQVWDKNPKARQWWRTQLEHRWGWQKDYILVVFQ